MKTAIFSLSLLIAANLSGADLDLVKNFKPSPDSGKIVYSNSFDDPAELKKKYPVGYQVIRGTGRNGTGALVFERKGKDQPYRLATFPVPNPEKGVSYSAVVYIRGENLKRIKGTSQQLGGLCIEYTKNGKWLSGTYYVLNMADQEWRRHELSVTHVPDVDMKITLYLRPEWEGKLFFDDLAFIRKGEMHSIFLTQPSQLMFRNAENDFTLCADAPSDTVMHVEIANAGKKQEMLLSGKNGMFRGKTGKLEPGQVVLKARAASMKKQIIYHEETFRLTCRTGEKAPSYAVTVDEHGRMIVDGRPFMPLGVFGLPDDKSLAEIKAAGCNIMQTYASINLFEGRKTGDRIKDIRAGLDRIHRHGLKHIFTFKDQMPNNKFAVTQMGKIKGLHEVTSAIAEGIKDHPALVAWMVSDEAHRPEVPDVVRTREAVAAGDPWHPTMSLTYRLEDLPYYAISGDILGLDLYPITTNQPRITLRKLVEVIEAGKRSGLPIWGIPQIFNWTTFKDKETFLRSRSLTRGEIMAPTLLYAISGAKGFLFYSYWDLMDYQKKRDPARAAREWKDVVSVIQALKKLEPFLMSTQKAPEISVEPKNSGSVYAKAFTAEDGRMCVVIAGIDDEAEAVITVSKGKMLKSEYGFTEYLGNGKHLFRTSKLNGDVLY